MIATSQFTISVINDGQAYALQPSNSVIIMEEDGDYKPSQLSFQSVKLKGTDNPSSYSGRFKIERTSDETNWTTEYTSSSDESSITYNMPSTIEEKTPYIYRPTCNGDNVGSKAFDTIVGGTIVWNQMVYDRAYADSGSYSGGGLEWTIDNDNHKITLTGTSTERTFIADFNMSSAAIKDHVYYIHLPVGLTLHANRTGWILTSNHNRGDTVAKANNNDTYANCRIEVMNADKTFNVTFWPRVFDLTQMFGLTIADHIYTLEQATAGAGVAWFKKFFPKDYYPYNAGELLSVSDLQNHDMVGFNQWDEKWESGSFNAGTGKPITNADWSRSSNYIKVVSGSTYHFEIEGMSESNGAYVFIYDANKNFLSYENLVTNNDRLMPSNAGFIRIQYKRTIDVVANYKVCIHLRWSGHRNGEYESYVKHSYPLDDSLTLRGIPKIDASGNLYYDGDRYLPDGTVERRYGVVDLGKLGWTFSSSPDWNCYYTTVNGRLKGSWNVLTAKYATAEVYKTSVDKIIYGNGSNSNIYIRDTAYADAAAFKAAMSGVMLVYELATPATEEAEPYQTPQIVDDFGTEEYVTGSIVPVGHETKYTQDISSIRCSLYASGGTTTLLDQQIIPIVNDAESAVYMTKQIEEYRLSDSSTSITGSGDGYDWVDTMPAVPPGKYIWKRLKSYFSNGSIAYSDAVCDVVMSGLVFDVDRNSNAITSKVWESDITTKINQYDGSTGAAIRNRVTQTETDISGINTSISDIRTDISKKADGSEVKTLTEKVNTVSDTVDSHTQTISSNTSRLDDAESEIQSTKTVANQTADKFTWLVKDGTSSSNFTLTSRVAELISPQLVIKDPAGNSTIISGGKLSTDAIKSNNYIASPNQSSPYSATGTFLDLADGTLYMPNFGVNGTTGAAYFNGTVNANAGKFGSDTSYWNIETVEDYNMTSHAALVGTGNAYIQTGNWQVSDNAVATRKYVSTSDSAGTVSYYKDTNTNTFYDVGMKIPTSFTKGNDSNEDRYHRAFFYQRNATGASIPSSDSGWNYPFIVDNEGRVYCTDLIIIGGGTGTTYLPLAGGTITGDLTVNVKTTLKGAVSTTLQLQTNLGSTSAATLTGNASAVVKPGVTGTLGVGNGGTGANSFTSGAVLIGNGGNAIQTRSIRNNTTQGALGWTSSSADNTIITTNTLAYWDGRYQTANNASNIQYVKLGKLGTVVTHDIEEFITTSGGVIDGSLSVVDLNAGNLVVTGAGRFTNGLYGDLIGNVTGNVTGSSTKVLDSGNGTETTFGYSKGAATAATYLAAWNDYELRAITPATVKTIMGLNNVNNTADANKNVATAAKFTSAQSITLTGDTTGTASSQAGWSIATTTKALSPIGTVSGDDHAKALKAYFDANKADIPRNKSISFYSSVGGNGSQAIGYFLNSFDSSPYGGFFVAHYSNPYYVGILGGTYTQQRIVTSTNYTDYTVTKTGTGASGTWGVSISGNAATATLATDADKLKYQTTINADTIDSFLEANRIKAALWNQPSISGVPNGILISGGYTSTTYGFQLAIDDDPTYMMALRQKNGNGWAAWKRIPMGDGTGASGTWSISVTGNAGTATTAGSLTTGRDFTIGKTTKSAVKWDGAVAFTQAEISDCASNTANGWMSKDDKAKLDQITVSDIGRVSADTIVGETNGGITVTVTSGVAKLKHTNQLSAAGTAQGTANGTTLTNGGTFTIPKITYDINGHITGATTNTLTLPSITSVTGNAGTATKFASAQSVTLTGDTTGTASSQAGWSVATKNVALSGLNSSWEPQSGTSARPTTANVNFHDNKVRYFLASASMTEGKPANDAKMLHLAWDNGAWDSQLAVVHHSDKPYIQIRSEYGTANTWGDWITVLDSNNYNSYSPKLDGTGASGTWGISISGNAATATTASYSYYPKIVATNEIRFDVGSKPSSAVTLCIGYKWSDGTKDAKISRYNFYNGNSELAEVQASTFYGSLSGNASSATKATQDGNGSVISSTYLKLSGGTMTGELKTNGANIVLGAPGTGSAPDDSGDLVWQHGNGTEKARLWTSSAAYTEKVGPSYRMYNGNNELLYNGYLPLADGTSATGTWGISITGTAAKATADASGNTISSTYLKLSGGTMTGAVNFPYNKQSISFRHDNASYDSGFVYGTGGNEALALVQQNAVTSFMVVHGSDPASWGSGSWNTSSPTIQTKNKSLYVNELITTGTTPAYNFKVNGTSYLGGEVRISNSNADTESVSMSYNENLCCLDFIFN